MGKVRVPGLNFSLDYLRTEIVCFGKFMHETSWMTEESLGKRRLACNGLVFIMLNLGDDVSQDAAWGLFHMVMDEYHDRCDLLHIRY